MITDKYNYSSMSSGMLNWYWINLKTYKLGQEKHCLSVPHLYPSFFKSMSFSLTFQWEAGIPQVEEFQRITIALSGQDPPQQCHLESLVHPVWVWGLGKEMERRLGANGWEFNSASVDRSRGFLPRDGLQYLHCSHLKSILDPSTSKFRFSAFFKFY